MEKTQFDLLILGAGPGGYVAAIHAARHGLSTAVIEKDSPGGVCLNMGCIPSKALIHQAEIFTSALAAQDLGVSVDTSKLDYSRVFAKSRTAADKLSNGVSFLLKKNKVTLIKGTGTVTSPATIEVKTGDSAAVTLEGKHLIIATGSSPRELPGFEFDEKTVLSSNGALLLEALPSTVAIIGAGAIGCEFAHILSSFGSKVTLVEMQGRILPFEDSDSAAVLAASFAKRKIDIHTETRASLLKKGSNGVLLKLEDSNGKVKEIEAEKVLVVTGRVPNTSGIGLEDLGVAMENGFVKTGPYYETSVKGVYAIGDIVPSPLLAHVASAEGEIAVSHIAGIPCPEKTDPLLIPSAVYTFPEVAGFGLSYEEAVKAGHETEKAVFPFRGSGRAVASEQTDGQVKILYDKSTKEILGASIAGPQATELIHEILLARAAELLPATIASLMHAHPTLSEALMEAAKEAEGGAVHI